MTDSQNIDVLRVFNRSDFIGPANFENSINIGLGEYASTPANSTNIYGAVNIGLGPITNFTVAATTGGSLAATTYYYKVYPFTVDTLVGLPSVETSVVVGGANNAVSISWTAVTGAVKYRIQRSTSSGGGGTPGYYEVTSTSYKDTGAAYTASGGAVTAGTNNWAVFSGTIFLPASSGAINWYNYTNGLAGGNITTTSAGELQIGTGKGVGQGNVLFLNSDFNQRLQIETESTPVTLRFTDVGSNLPGKISCATSFEIAVGSNPSPTVATFGDSLLTFVKPLRNTLQPSFLATRATNNANSTGDGTAVTIIYNTEIYDQGSNYDNTTGVFTAPLTGRYLLNCSCLFDSILLAHNAKRIDLITSNRTYTHYNDYALAQQDMTLNLSVIADMDAGDTASVVVKVSGSTKTVATAGDAGTTYFSGTMLA